MIKNNNHRIRKPIHWKKWNQNKKAKFPSTFTNVYQTTQTKVINKKNHIDFLI